MAAALSVVPERDRKNIGKVVSEFCESQVKEGEETGKETIQEVELEKSTKVLERDNTKVGDSSSNPEKCKVEEKGEVEREAEQVEDVVEPIRDLERDDSLAGEVISEPVTQVMELKKDGDPFVPPATGGLATNGTPEI